MIKLYSVINVIQYSVIANTYKVCMVFADFIAHFFGLCIG